MPRNSSSRHETPHDQAEPGLVLGKSCIFDVAARVAIEGTARVFSRDRRIRARGVRFAGMELLRGPESFCVAGRVSCAI